MFDLSNVFRFHPLLGFSVIFYIMVVISLVQGRISHRYTTPVYRAEDPSTFRNYIALYLILGTGCLILSLKNWTTKFDPPEYSYYVATANPQQSLETVLQAASSIHSNGEIAYGLTNWYVEWHFQWSQEKHGSACWISSVYTTLSSKIVLPKLVNATAAQQEKFNIFFDALGEHQLAHYEFGKSAAQEIERKISTLSKMQDCNILEAAGNAVGEEILKNYQIKERAYDLSNTFLQSQHAMLE